MSEAAFSPLVVRKTPNPNIKGAHWRELLTADGETVIAEVFAWSGPDGDKDDARAEAYANLFRAAPDLYKAVERALRHAENIGIDSEGSSYVDTLRSAHSKARGEG